MNQLTYFSQTPNLLYDPSWESFFQKESNQPYFQELTRFLAEKEGGSKDVYPPKELVFNAFRQCPLDHVRVVILGQDPYHGCGQAHGLSFSVCQGVSTPPSLRNIFKELKTDLHIKDPAHGCLLSWAHQGVFLLNATLTVEAGDPKSHYGQGWEVFTDHVIAEIADQNKPTVFMLWGRSAQEKCLNVLDSHPSKRFLILKTTHPSPFSAHHGFLGARHFSKANEFLVKNGLEPIDWSVN